MKERLKRRKKEPEKAGGESAAAPLQPAFYDTESARIAPAGAGRGASQEAAAPAPEAPTEQALTPSSSAESISAQSSSMPSAAAISSGQAPSAHPQRSGGQDGTRRRRRRGRGGRGRGRNGVRPAQVVGDKTGPADELLASSDASEPAPASSEVAGQTAPRPSKGAVVLAIGLPGSGKSSWFKRHNITPLSSDLLRGLLFDDPTEQRFQDLVFSNLRSMLKARLIARRPMSCVDATNLTSHDRHGWIKLAKDYGYEVQAVFFDVPVDVCLQRNRKRDRVVAEDVMRRMAGKIKPPTFEEGFSKITVVRVKQKE